MRETEFGPSQDERGHQQFRSALPIRPVAHDFHAAADGQLGGIMKVYREWRISGDTEWLRALWPKVKAQPRLLHRDLGPGPQGRGRGAASQHLRHRVLGPGRHVHELLPGRAAGRGRSWAQALGDDVAAVRRRCWTRARRAGRGRAVRRRVLHPEDRVEEPAREEPAGGQEHRSAATRPRRVALLEKEGPKYQYGTGCLSDGVLGSWLALVCGVGQVLDAPKVASHLQAVHQYNLEARPLGPRQSAAAELRLRRRGRAAALHLAQGRRALAAVRLLRTKSGPASNTRSPRT